MLVLDVLREVARRRDPSTEDLESSLGSLLDVEGGLLDALDICIDHGLLRSRLVGGRDAYFLTTRGRHALGAGATGSAAA